MSRTTETAAAAIDLRSDTVTRPTEEMRRAMYEAEVGDDVYGEDPTLNKLEALSAEVTGKEGAVFVPSGTFGNQLALFSHCNRGNEVVLSDTSHIVQNEVGAAAVIAGVQLRTFTPRGGYPLWREIEPLIRIGEDLHWPKTELIALENALGNGEVMPMEVSEEIAREARALGIPVHLDGARIFNAAHYLGVEPSRIAACADSVMFCLSKGLCAPVGSMLVGSAPFIEVARKKRKIMGGGMRQVGILAAAGLIALQKMRQRLPEDREKAETLAEVFRASGLFEMQPETTKINMFFVRYRDGAFAGQEAKLVEDLGRKGLRINPPDGGWIRLVAHNDLSREQTLTACRIVERTIGSSRK